ncbi:MAG TPA: hypothetical protein VFE46_16550 [Pirellulales bacterium]|nr:hypothetical protein [Pirellulales bacterium]
MALPFVFGENIVSTTKSTTALGILIVLTFGIIWTVASQYPTKAELEQKAQTKMIEDAVNAAQQKHLHEWEDEWQRRWGEPAPTVLYRQSQDAKNGNQ